MHDNETRSDIGRGALRLENNRILVYERNGIYQARIRTKANRYLWRSLNTRNQSEAISAARKLFHWIEFRKQLRLPIGSRNVNRVIDEYVALRETQQAQGSTSIHMLRQIIRVVKFWRAYIGDQAIENIGNKELSGFIEWRKSYYAQFKTLPKNAKLNPTDKTLQWETTLGNAIIRWAHEQGYRGDRPLPTFSFTPKIKRVRPAFELFEYRRLLRALIKWRRDCPNETWLRARRLLADYVLILANSGMRVGEANNLKIRDLETFKDDLGRRNYRFKVKGKTGERDVILRASAAKSVDRLLARRMGAGADNWLFVVIGEGGRVRDEITLDASQTKGNQARRVFVNAKLKKELGSYIKASCANCKPSDPLFRSQKRRAFNANTMYQLFGTIYSECGIKGASSHSGRRTFITNLAGKSVSVRVLAVLAGHSSISTTQRYIDVNDQQLRNAVELA